MKNQNISIPLIVSGGMGKLEDLNDLYNIDFIDTVAIADLLHYKRKSIQQIKSYANDIGFEIRKFNDFDFRLWSWKFIKYSKSI